jgi:predicted glycogen debranching enzyme
VTANQSATLRCFSEEYVWDDAKILEMFTQAASTFVKTIDGWTQIWAASRDWFLEEWGRDTFIALPGILLATGRFEEAQSVLRHFAQYMESGLVLNRIHDGEMQFNTVDGSMWYIQALKKYNEYTDDWVFVEEMLPSVMDIIEAYRKGTTYQRNGIFSITMDSDGLIISPPQATWMDADPSGKGDEIVTPRNGKAVEINALWYANLVWVGEAMCHTGCRRRSTAFGGLNKLAMNVKKSFKKKFWNEEEQYLFDVIEGDPHSGALRPNQIIAVSHGGDLLTKKQKKLVFDAVTQDLLTPGGLRTLSPRDSHYRGTYDTFAPMSEKDCAYHQGTVWPWLFGPYCDALAIIRKSQNIKSVAIKKELTVLLTPLVRFCIESEFKSLPEVFSGDVPHEPGGTTSQAWSIAEVLRIICEQKLVKRK